MELWAICSNKNRAIDMWNEMMDKDLWSARKIQHIHFARVIAHTHAPNQVEFALATLWHCLHLKTDLSALIIAWVMSWINVLDLGREETRTHRYKTYGTRDDGGSSNGEGTRTGGKREEGSYS